MLKFTSVFFSHPKPICDIAQHMHTSDTDIENTVLCNRMLKSSRGSQD